MDIVSPKDLTIRTIVDSRGSACPEPLMTAKSVMVTLKPEEIMQVLSSDECSRSDIPNWAIRQGYEHLGTVEKKGYFEIYIQKK
jgi:TusA-related sulfurtransferase